ncbi:zinc finger BED domain-containing protein RICESLEEPER 2-like [Cynara cardunculus var. scolymus]|uniref:zinc finger BED domain-containing protein RICESLEEPER 2-like n=1 Tax=Cynara cardunculus var. scolymus TaxID=59895 RepID=UPI000D62E44D|nr:zinc finger BED domain-containing protein RICESLEEPER 2-like [Cynara cardunculus var. scolymus]
MDMTVVSLDDLTSCLADDKEGKKDLAAARALQKPTVISFVRIHSHKGESIDKATESCLLDWGVKNSFTITVDNASSNDIAVGFTKKKVVNWGGSSTRAGYIHMRYIAHILNLVVQDGLKLADTSVKKIKDCIRWVKGSPSRLKKFRELVELLEVEEKSSLYLVVPTRWNSTYMMLRTAIAYRQVFETYESSDNAFTLDLGDSVPLYVHWLSVDSMVIFFKTFYEMTIRISGSLYVTSNSFLIEISDLSCIIADMLQSKSKVEEEMGGKMKEKFSKYWGDPDKMNFLIFFGNILDPRDKVEYMQVQLNQMYGEDQGKSCFEKVNSKLNMLPPPPIKCENVPVRRVQSRLKSQLKKQKMESGASLSQKSELEHYLSESTIDDTNDFDILRWWKVSSKRFPILSKLARDVLVVPISIVASESTFSTSGRVLDNFRSSLSPEMIESLICTQGMLRGPSQPIAVEENIDDIEKFEKVAAVPTTPLDADAQVEKAEENEADAITSHEAEVVAEDEETDDAKLNVKKQRS